MVLVSTLFQMFIELGMYNFEYKLKKKIHMYDVCMYDEYYTYCKFDHQSINDTSHHRDEIKGVPWVFEVTLRRKQKLVNQPK